MVVDLGKLILRAYNSEADNVVRTLKPYNLAAALDRLEKLRASIAKLGASMKLGITDAYHALRVQEITLTADYLAKVAEEKEHERAENERLREERKAKEALEREQARLEEEKAKYEVVLQALRQNADGATADVEAKLDEIQRALDGVHQRSANLKAGYVYVISNIGSFGDTVVKIGATRRVDPQVRVRELGDASVPFRFDVHALFFSERAFELEAALHREFAARRINLVNAHREFFYASPAEVREALVRLEGNLLTFVEAPEALEWHQSQNARRSSSSMPELNRVIDQGTSGIER